MKRPIAKHGLTIVAKSIKKVVVDTPTIFFGNENCFIMDKECFDTWYDYEI